MIQIVTQKTNTKKRFGINSLTLEELKEFSFKQGALEASWQKWGNFDEVWRSGARSNVVTRCLRHALLVASLPHHCGRGSYGPWSLISNTPQCWDRSVRCRRLPSVHHAHLPGTIKPLPTGAGWWVRNERTPTSLWWTGNKSCDVLIDLGLETGLKKFNTTEEEFMEISSVLCMGAIHLMPITIVMFI